MLISEQLGKEAFDNKFGCHKNRKEEVGKHSNYSYQSFLDFQTQQQIALLKIVVEELNKAIEQCHGGGNGRRLLLQVKESIKEYKRK